MKYIQFILLKVSRRFIVVFSSNVLPYEGQYQIIENLTIEEIGQIMGGN